MHLVDVGKQISMALLQYVRQLPIKYFTSLYNFVHYGEVLSNKMSHF